MSKYFKGTALIIAGVCLGFPSGYLLNSINKEAPSKNADELQLSFKRDYFENLPVSQDGNSRILNVGTFHFDADGDGKPDPGKSVTVPLLGMNDLPESHRFAGESR